MQKFICLIALLSIFSGRAFADAVTVSNSGSNQILKIEDETAGIGWALFHAMREYSTDPLDKQNQNEYSGPGYKVLQWMKYDDAMDGEAYVIEFTLGAQDNLQIQRQGRKITASFEGRLASALFQGLYKRRLYSEKYYELTEGPYYGDYFIRTVSYFYDIECKYATREPSREKYAACSLIMIQD